MQSKMIVDFFSEAVSVLARISLFFFAVSVRSFKERRAYHQIGNWWKGNLERDQKHNSGYTNNRERRVA